MNIWKIYWSQVSNTGLVETSQFFLIKWPKNECSLYTADHELCNISDKKSIIYLYSWLRTKWAKLVDGRFDYIVSTRATLYIVILVLLPNIYLKKDFNDSEELNNTCVDKGMKKCDSWAKSGLPPAFINRVLLTHSHSFGLWPFFSYNGRTKSFI